MARKSNRFAVLQFDERLIAFLRAERSDKGVHVVEAVRVYGEWTDEAQLQKALKEFVREHRLAAEPVYAVLPRYDITARLLALPTHEAGEVASMVRLSAEDHVPYPVEDLVIDQCVLQRLPDGTSRVFAALAHRDVVERHVRFLREAGIEPERVYLSSTCLASAAAAALRGSEERYALVNLSPGGVEVLVMNGPRLEYGRGVVSHRDGSLEDQPLDGLTEEMALEVRASIAAHRRESEDGEGVDRIYLCSEWADVGALCERLAGETGYECSPVPLDSGLVTRGREHLAAVPLVPLGAALTAQGRAAFAVDLVPASLADARAAAARKRRLIVGAALAAAVLLAIGGVFAQQVHVRRAYARELETRVEALRPEAEGVLEKRKQLRILMRQVDPSGSALETLSRAVELAPEAGLTITQFTYERGVRIDIQGRARTTDEIDQFTSSLRDEGGTLFAQARRGATKPAVEPSGNEAVEYTIAVPFSSVEAEEGEEAAVE